MQKMARHSRGRNSASVLPSAFGGFAADSALDYEVLKQAPDAFEVNVTECRYSLARIGNVFLVHEN